MAKSKAKAAVVAKVVVESKVINKEGTKMRNYLKYQASEQCKKA